MDRIESTAAVIKDLNKFFSNELAEHLLVKRICEYFDSVKTLKLTSSDLKFLKYISNIAGIPHYYDLLFDKFGQKNTFEHYDLNTMSAMMFESTLHVDENIKIHKYQKQVLDKFKIENQNRFFLSATTSFGKTFLIYEIIKKLRYKNIALIFPTIALLSENYERIFTDSNYSYFYDQFDIHTLSDIEEFSGKNIFIFTPERYLSFMDRHPDVNLDFVFVDEIYKIDNEYLIDTISKENERDTAYRIALQNILSNSRDVLLVGPYIEFPNKDDKQVNQSFNVFLSSNLFEIIDYNNYEIVNKSSTLVKNCSLQIDNWLTLELKGYSKKTKGEQVSKTVSDIRAIKENAILYTMGPGKAESYAKILIEYSSIEHYDLSNELSAFINHLINSYKYDEWIVIHALKHRIGIHHGLVPKYIQKEIINFFNCGDLDILVSTTTITEGVNTSAKNLLVLNAKKGDKDLKTFDAKNIAGRAGRFLHHYSGRVIIFDKKFQDIIQGSDNEIKHKNFDPLAKKDEIDYFITEESYLSKEDILNRQKIINKQIERGIPNEIMSMFRVVSHSDKITVYDNIVALNNTQLYQIRRLIQSIHSNLSIDYNGFKVVLKVIKPIVKNANLIFLIENETQLRHGVNAGNNYSTLIYILSAYLAEGFSGSVRYNLSRKHPSGREFTIDEAVRDSSKFIFSTLKYQLVKYLGVFNLMYKYYLSVKESKNLDDIVGIDRLLLKLEYNATSAKGRLASDYGVPSKIVEYYDQEEASNVREKFDAFEKAKFLQIESILNK